MRIEALTCAALKPEWSAWLQQVYSTRVFAVNGGFPDAWFTF
jgi:hypothetical protein